MKSSSSAAILAPSHWSMIVRARRDASSRFKDRMRCLTRGRLGADIDSSRINIVDLRASKSLRLSGPLRLELVAQIFNLFNTTNLQAQYGGGRVGNALSASFGRILTARPGTQGELAAKISW